MVVKIFNASGNVLPNRATKGSSGYDIRAFLDKPVTIAPMERALIPTGLYTEFDAEFELLLTPRSGLALKKGITVLNAPATIDSDYRREIGVVLINLGNKDVVINNGDKICQAKVYKPEPIEFIQVDKVTDLAPSDRDGFGSTGR